MIKAAKSSNFPYERIRERNKETTQTVLLLTYASLQTLYTSVRNVDLLYKHSMLFMINNNFALLEEVIR